MPIHNRELIMLRDTLRARLLPDEWQRRLPPEATEGEIPQRHPPKMAKPHRGGAERDK